jgi:transcriptional regulator with XRE-family HTH domain
MVSVMPGTNIRRHRLQSGLSLRQLADRAGVSPSLISQVERGVTDPSISSLRRIAEALDVSIFYLLGEANGAPPRPRLEGSIVRSTRRRRVLLPDSGLEYELLCPDVDRQMEVWIGRLEPGAATADTPRGHAGEELMLVLSGRMELEYGGEVVELGPDDSIYIDGTTPHRHRAVGEQPLIFLSALTPPIL